MSSLKVDRGRAGTVVKPARPRTTAGVAVALALVVVLWGGYSHRWPWTGIDGSTATLWDWLHLLLLPFAFVLLPVWMRLDTRVDARSKRIGAAVAGVFGLVVVLGYLVPWAWTGFRGNTLWDWLSLVVLPLAVASAPRVRERRGRWTRRHRLIGGACVAAFLVVVAGGYLGPWGWTGFTGNTLWNWMNLLFLPLLIPALVVPALTPVATARIVYLDADGKPVAEKRVPEEHVDGEPVAGTGAAEEPVGEAVPAASPSASGASAEPAASA